MKGLQGLDAFGLTFAKMRAFNDPNASLQHISQAITSDIVFSSKVLKTANSPYFGMQGQVSSLHHAVLILGLNNLKTLYFQDHFKMLGSETGPPGPDSQRGMEAFHFHGYLRFPYLHSLSSSGCGNGVHSWSDPRPRQTGARGYDAAIAAAR